MKDLKITITPETLLQMQQELIFEVCVIKAFEATDTTKALFYNQGILDTVEYLYGVMEEKYQSEVEEGVH
jgi:hypothetical protein